MRHGTTGHKGVKYSATTYTRGRSNTFAILNIVGNNTLSLFRACARARFVSRLPIHKREESEAFFPPFSPFLLPSPLLLRRHGPFLSYLLRQAISKISLGRRRRLPSSFSLFLSASLVLSFRFSLRRFEHPSSSSAPRFSSRITDQRKKERRP